LIVRFAGRCVFFTRRPAVLTGLPTWFAGVGDLERRLTVFVNHFTS
jgi:hypothetical protein